MTTEITFCGVAVGPLVGVFWADWDEQGFMGKIRGLCQLLIDCLPAVTRFDNSVEELLHVTQGIELISSHVGLVGGGHVREDARNADGVVVVRRWRDVSRGQTTSNGCHGVSFQMSEPGREAAFQVRG